MSNATPPAQPESTLEKVTSVSNEVASIAGVAASLAPVAGPYGLIAATVLSGLELLAKEAPAAYTAIASALGTANPTPADFATLRANVVALQLD